MWVIKPLNDEKSAVSLNNRSLCNAVTMKIQLSAARRVVNRHFSLNSFKLWPYNFHGESFE
jgi:hypothetical protein